MPNDPSLFYCSVANYKVESTQLGYLSTLTDDQIKALLLDVMLHIDGYIGAGWVPLDSAQEFIFPRYDDTENGTAFIPRAIKSATILIADDFCFKRSKGVSPDDILSESDLGYSYTKAQSKRKNSLFPDAATALLDNFRISQGGFLGV